MKHKTFKNVYISYLTCFYMFLLYNSKTLTIGTEHQILFDYKTDRQKTVHYQIQPNFKTTYIFRDFHLVHSFKGDFELKIFETIASIR